MQTTLQKLTQKIIQKCHLSTIEMNEALTAMCHGVDIYPDTIKHFLLAMNAKGETAVELYGLVLAMQKMMQTVHLPVPAIDIVGTGGDQQNTINISTGSALLTASMGINVAKHGNRAVSSLAGSADVLTALELPFPENETAVIQQIQQHHFAFMFAPHFHPALAALKKIRSQLGQPSILNKVGPLLNPAQVPFILLGIADPLYLPLFRDVLLKLKIRHAFLFHGAGLDELSTVPKKLNIIEIRAGKATTLHLKPADYGFSAAKMTDLIGGDAKENAARLLNTLQGEKSPLADTLILNAAVAAYITGKTNSIEAGILQAKQAHASGQAYRLIKKIQKERHNA